MARLIKSEKEVEGRYEEVWTLVEEDALVQWPAGPGAVVGRDAPRLDGYEKARGEARYTGDIKLPGMLESALLRSPHARATRAPHRPRRGGGRARRARRHRAGRGGRDRGGGALRRRRGGGRRGRDARAGRAALELIEVEWEELEPLLDADEAVARGSRDPGVAPLRARRLRAGARRGRRGRRGRVHDADAQPQPARDAPVRLRVARRRPRRLRLDPVHLGDPPRPGRGASACRRTRCASSASSWAAASAPRPASATTSCSPPSSRGGPAGRCAARSRGARRTSSRGNRNATSQRVTAAARADGTLTALGGEYTCALGWSGWLPPTAGPTQLLYACENVRTVEHGAKLNLPPMAAFRAPGFVEGTWSLECVLDKLAAQLGVDPLELRKLNYADVGRDGRPPVLLEEPDGVLPARRAALGAAATRCAPARTRSGSAGWGWRARSGTAAAARPATRGCGSAPTGARTSSPRCRTSARARARRWR